MATVVELVNRTVVVVPRFGHRVGDLEEHLPKMSKKLAPKKTVTTNKENDRIVS